MKGPLAGRDRVGVAGNRAEAGAAIVQEDPALRRHDAGAERGKQRVDERHGVAVAIDGAEVDRIGVLGAAVPVRAGQGAVEPDFPACALGPVIGEETLDVDGNLRRVGDVIVADKIGRLGRLGEQVQPVGFAQAIVAHREALELPQDHQRR